MSAFREVFSAAASCAACADPWVLATMARTASSLLFHVPGEHQRSISAAMVSHLSSFSSCFSNVGSLADFIFTTFGVWEDVPFPDQLALLEGVADREGALRRRDRRRVLAGVCRLRSRCGAAADTTALEPLVDTITQGRVKCPDEMLQACSAPAGLSAGLCQELSGALAAAPPLRMIASRPQQLLPLLPTAQ